MIEHILVGMAVIGLLCLGAGFSPAIRSALFPVDEGREAPLDSDDFPNHGAE